MSPSAKKVPDPWLRALLGGPKPTKTPHGDGTASNALRLKVVFKNIPKCVSRQHKRPLGLLELVLKDSAVSAQPCPPKMLTGAP